MEPVPPEVPPEVPLVEVPLVEVPLVEVPPPELPKEVLPLLPDWAPVSLDLAPQPPPASRSGRPRADRVIQRGMSRDGDVS